MVLALRQSTAFGADSFSGIQSQDLDKLAQEIHDRLVKDILVMLEARFRSKRFGKALMPVPLKGTRAYTNGPTPRQVGDPPPPPVDYEAEFQTWMNLQATQAAITAGNFTMNWNMPLAFTDIAEFVHWYSTRPDSRKIMLLQWLQSIGMTQYALNSLSSAGVIPDTGDGGGGGTGVTYSPIGPINIPSSPSMPAGFGYVQTAINWASDSLEDAINFIIRHVNRGLNWFLSKADWWGVTWIKDFVADPMDTVNGIWEWINRQVVLILTAPLNAVRLFIIKFGEEYSNMLTQLESAAATQASSVKAAAVTQAHIEFSELQSSTPWTNVLQIVEAGVRGANSLVRDMFGGLGSILRRAIETGEGIINQLNPLKDLHIIAPSEIQRLRVISQEIGNLQRSLGDQFGTPTGAARWKPLLRERNRILIKVTGKMVLRIGRNFIFNLVVPAIQALASMLAQVFRAIVRVAIRWGKPFARLAFNVMISPARISSWLVFNTMDIAWQERSLAKGKDIEGKRGPGQKIREFANLFGFSKDWSAALFWIGSSAVISLPIIWFGYKGVENLHQGWDIRKKTKKVQKLQQKGYPVEMELSLEDF